VPFNTVWTYSRGAKGKTGLGVGGDGNGNRVGGGTTVGSIDDGAAEKVGGSSSPPVIIGAVLLEREAATGTSGIIDDGPRI
jgi:hypothetical protein